jgi:hypothetical protein
VGGQIVGISGEKAGDLFPNGRIKKSLGHERNDFVALVSPRGCRSAAKGEEAGGECESEYESACRGHLLIVPRIGQRKEASNR